MVPLLIGLTVACYLLGVGHLLGAIVRRRPDWATRSGRLAGLCLLLGIAAWAAHLIPGFAEVAAAAAADRTEVLRQRIEAGLPIVALTLGSVGLLVVAFLVRFLLRRAASPSPAMPPA